MALLATVVVTERAHSRRPVRLDGTLRLENEPFDITIDDLSISGFGATTDADLCPGDRIRIASPAIQTRNAEVIWARNGKVGFRFLNPLSTEEVLSAHPVDTVISFAPADYPEPVVEKWPRILRVAIIVGLSTIFWVIIVTLARLL